MQLSPEQTIQLTAGIARALARHQAGKGVQRNADTAAAVARDGRAIVEEIIVQGRDPERIAIAAAAAADIAAELAGLGHPLDADLVALRSLQFADAVMGEVRR